MPPMRRVASGQQPGDREIAAFADLTSRPLVIAVRNDHRRALPPHRRIPADAVIFRMNWFFLESHYYCHVDAWFFAVPHRSLEETLRRSWAKRYTVDRLLSPMHIPHGVTGIVGATPCWICRSSSTTTGPLFRHLGLPGRS